MQHVVPQTKLNMNTFQVPGTSSNKIQQDPAVFMLRELSVTGNKTPDYQCGKAGADSYLGSATHYAFQTVYCYKKKHL